MRNGLAHAPLLCSSSLMDSTPPIAFDIPLATVRKWNSFETNRPLALTLSRQDVDNLFFAIDENVRATAAVQKALVEYTNGNLDIANASSAEASTRLAASANRLRLFMNSVMASAELAE